MAVLKHVGVLFGVCLAAIVLAAGPALAATKVTVSISDVRAYSVQVSWTQTNDSCFQDYRLQYQRTTAAGWSDDVVINSSTTTSYQSVGYSADIAYNFRVVDENCTGVQASDPVPFHTLQAPNYGAVAAAGFGALFIGLLVLVLIAAGIGFVIRLMKRAAVRALMPGASKDLPTATIPGVTSSMPTPSVGDSSSMYQGGQQGGYIQAPQPAGPMPFNFCQNCGSALAGPFCAKCGNKNW